MNYLNYKFVLSALAFLAMTVTPDSLVAKEVYRYEPGKLIENKADLHCQSLASISLGRQENLSISVHTKPEFIGTAHNGKKVIVVTYPYRNDGVQFTCVFYDYTNGQLQLMEFGHVGPKVDDVTKVKLLY